MGHEFASCCLNQFASADPWSNIRVLILKKGSQPFTLVLDLGSVTSFKQQALTANPGYDRMYLERNIMDNEQLKRIADALEEVLRLVKKDQEESKKRWEKEDDKI